MYRWFLRHFPRGGSYADIHHALIEEGYTDWAESLVEYAWKKWLADENFAHQEVSSMQKLATDPGERLFCSQFVRSDDHARLGCCEDNARIATAGMPRKLPVWVIACGLEVSALTVTLAAPVHAHGLL